MAAASARRVLPAALFLALAGCKLAECGKRPAVDAAPAEAAAPPDVAKAPVLEDAAGAPDATTAEDAGAVPEVEAIRSKPRCPGDVAVIDLDARHGFAGKVVVRGCPDEEDVKSFDVADGGAPSQEGEIVLQDPDGKRVHAMKLEEGFVSVTVADVYGDGRPVFVVKSFYLPCMGSFNCGARAYFYEIATGKLSRLEAVNEEGKREAITVIDALAVRWHLGKARNRRGLDVFKMGSYPDFDAPHDAGDPYPRRTLLTRWAFEQGR